MDTTPLGLMLGSLLGWSVAGIAALFIARLAYRLITPFNEREELIRDQNAAVGISQGLFMVGAAIILHGLLTGDPLYPVWWQELGYIVSAYLLSLALLWLGRIALKKLVRFDLDTQIHEHDNVAVGWLEGCSYLGFAIVVHSAL